jgi:hypothetical protein
MNGTHTGLSQYQKGTLKLCLDLEMRLGHAFEASDISVMEVLDDPNLYREVHNLLVDYPESRQLLSIWMFNKLESVKRGESPVYPYTGL